MNEKEPTAPWDFVRGFICAGSLAAIAFILTCGHCHAQSKAATIANFTLRAADSAQTCVLLHQPGGREIFLPIHNCAGIAGYNMAVAGGAWYVDRKLVQHGHPRWAKAQWVAIAFDAAAIGFTTYHQVKGIRPGGTR